MAIPEIIEVEKLKRQLEPAWIGRRVSHYTAPEDSPEPRKYAQDGWARHRSGTEGYRIFEIDRIGKHLWVQLLSQAWHIHLSSTGWFMPGNEKARNAAQVDPIHQNFLHTVNEKNVRVRVHLDDGQVWNYHDSRTWGKWWIKNFVAMRNDPYFQGYGPDWLKRPAEAKLRLTTYRGSGTLKTVLCDQKITAGLGNYLACEIVHRAGLHPHQLWQKTSPTFRVKIAECTETVLAECMASDNHDHWRVFGRRGEPCGTCQDDTIQYAKDGSGSRGSYYCGTCQPKA